MHQPSPTRKATSAQSVTAHPLAFVSLVLANLLLAFGPVFVRMSDVGPVAAGFWRIALAAPILVAVAFGSGWRPAGMSKTLWWVLGIGGLCFAADLASWHIGIHKTQLANATLFGNSATLIFPIYGFLVARAWPSRTQAVALIIALIGAALLMGRSFQISSDNLRGDLFCLLAGVLYTVYFAAMAKARDTMPPVPALAISTLMGMLPLLVFALLLGERVMPHDWTPLIALALASQVFGQGLMIFALGQLSPMVIGIGLLIQPVVAGIIGWTHYGEKLDGVDLVGALLVAVALVLVRRERKSTAPLAPEAPTGA
ncbi:MAG: DMT family transporter [Pseudomonadota bacterium]